jgi:hypothetical protein
VGPVRLGRLRQRAAWAPDADRRRSAGDGLGRVTKKTKHICWDGCMFPNEVLMKQQTWNDILAAMIEVRNNHGWVA